MSNALLVAACVLFGASGLVALLGPRGARAMDEARQTGWVAPKPARQMGDGQQ